MQFTKKLAIAFAPNGALLGLALHEAEIINGREFDVEGTPRAIVPGDAEGVAAAMSQLQVSALLTVEQKTAEIATLTGERDAARARITELEAKLAPTPVLLPVGAFISRFTDEEFIAVRALAQTDATAAGFVARTAQPEPINLASPLLQAAMKYLVAKKVIASDRVAALGAAPEARA